MKKYSVLFGGNVSSFARIEVLANSKSEAEMVAWDLVRTSGPDWDPDDGEPGDIDVCDVEEVE